MRNEIRFAVGRRDDLRSSVWRLWANRDRDDNLYLAARSLAGLSKISFHESGICRLADVSTEARRAAAAWACPTQSFSGVTPIFAILVPPINVEGRFTDTLPPKEKSIAFAPIAGLATKIIFLILLTNKLLQESDIRKASDRTIFFHGRIFTKRRAAWVVSYHDGHFLEEYGIVMKHVNDLKINLHPTAKKSDVKWAGMHIFNVSNGNPRVTDVPLGIGNVHQPENEG